jgi:hypothetical protein
MTHTIEAPVARAQMLIRKPVSTSSRTVPRTRSSRAGIPAARRELRALPPGSLRPLFKEEPS